MVISLNGVIPRYIDKGKALASQAWGKNLEIKIGQHVHIVAPSGTGKSSIIHFIYGLRNDYEGTITYDGKNIDKLNSDEFAIYRQQKVSIVFQDLRLFENQTAFENIEIKRALNPYHKVDAIKEMAARLGIEDKLNQSAGSCSYGEKQRIAIIRALMQPFDFLLLDEPYSHLDENNRKKAMELIYEECAQRGAAMVFADLKPLELLSGEKILML
jgi:putative ABC transport system ATP-binding protein